MAEEYEPRFFTFPRLSVQGTILHLTGINLLVIGAGIVIALIATTAGGPLGLLLTSPIWVSLAVLGAINVRSTPLPVIVWREIMFINRKRKGRTTYRHRPDVPELSELRRESVLLLPGRLRNVRLLDTDGFAIVHDTAQQTATLIATVVAPSFDYSPAHRQGDVPLSGGVSSAPCRSVVLV